MFLTIAFFTNNLSLRRKKMKKILSIILLAMVSVSFVAAANVDVYNNVKVGVGIFNGQRTLNIKSGDSTYAIDASEVKRTD